MVTFIYVLPELNVHCCLGFSLAGESRGYSRMATLPFFKIFFLMWTIVKVFIESVTILLLFYVLFLCVCVGFSVWASHCGGSSCCGAQALGHAGLSSCCIRAQ